MSATPRKKRLSRAEAKAETRKALLDAAGAVFAEHGFHGASIDMVADAAGYTKGAVYANFSSKDELYLALLDAQLSTDHGGLEQLIESGTPIEALREEIAEKFTEEMERTRQWALLTLEFFTHALRDETIREKLAARIQHAREGYMQSLQKHVEVTGKKLSMPAEQAAAAFLAFENGLSVFWLLDPQPVWADLYPAMLQKMLE